MTPIATSSPNGLDSRLGPLAIGPSDDTIRARAGEGRHTLALARDGEGHREDRLAAERGDGVLAPFDQEDGALAPPLAQAEPRDLDRQNPAHAGGRGPRARGARVASRTRGRARRWGS